jgi:hypothetical protein
MVLELATKCDNILVCVNHKLMEIPFSTNKDKEIKYKLCV